VLSSSEERIRELCSKAVAATDPAEIDPILAALKLALHEHIQQLRAEAKKLRAELVRK
jgi:hypothetical protein